MDPIVRVRNSTQSRRVRFDSLEHMLILIKCPEPTCPATAEVTEVFRLESTDGPVDHMVTYCLARHVFRMPLSKADTAQYAGWW